MKQAVIISCFHKWYYRRLKYIENYLSENNYNVTIIVSDFDHISKEYVDNKEEKCTYVSVPRYTKNISIKRVVSHYTFGYKTSQIIDSIRPDLLYVLVPPNSVVNACVKYKRKNPDTKLIVDVIDLWPESMPNKFIRKLPFMGIWKRMRKNGIINSDYIFTECQLYQQTLNDSSKRPPMSTLYLVKEQSQIEKDNIKKSIDDSSEGNKGIIRFAYVGSMNNILDIDGIVGILSSCINRGFDIELYAIGDGINRSGFEEAVKSTGCIAHFYGFVFEELEKIEILSKCDYAFNMMKDTSMVGLSIKSIDYLSYGLPLINNIKGDTWEMVDRGRIGINISSSDDFINNNISFNHKEIIDFFERNFTTSAFMSTLEQSLSDII